jgi:hypothetical protein
MVAVGGGPGREQGGAPVVASRSVGSLYSDAMRILITVRAATSATDWSTG